MFRPFFPATSNRPNPVSASRSRNRSNRSEGYRKTVVVILICLATIGAFYALSRLGPKSYTIAERRSTISNAQAEKLRLLAEQAETRWNEIKKSRTQSKSPYTEDDLAVIGEAAVARFQYENQVEGADTRYPALKKELHDRMGESLRKRSRNLEQSARGEAEDKHYAQAAELFRAALELEQIILSDYPESAYADTQRRVNLTGQVRIMTARPMWDASEADERAGEEAYSRGDIASATALVERAAKSNYVLDREYQGLTKADNTRTLRLERRLATLRSIPIRDHAMGLLVKAEAEAAARHYANVPSYREAVEADTRRLSTEFSEGDFSTPALTGDMVRRAQNAASSPDVEAIRRDLAAFDLSVRASGADAARLLENLQRSIQRLREAYPQSDTLEKSTDERIAYLFEHRSEIATVRARVVALLIPVPGAAGLSASRTETDQRLYVLLMGDNPSVRSSDARPVESLTRAEAARFCERLGWMIARKVRLPVESEFRLMAAAAAVKPADYARAIDNCDGTPGEAPSAKADPAGFNDVLGNVSEWIATPGADHRTAKIAGGNVENTLAELTRIPVQSVPATQRSRFTGFRFVVETDSAR